MSPKVNADDKNCKGFLFTTVNTHISRISCMPRTQSVREILSANLRMLMDRDGIESDRALATRAKMPAATVHKVLKMKSSTTVDTLVQLAKTFSVQPWELLVPDLQIDMLSSAGLRGVLRSYTEASTQGRDVIRMVAEREAEYAARVVPVGAGVGTPAEADRDKARLKKPADVSVPSSATKEGPPHERR